jgi:hypothetical protein
MRQALTALRLVSTLLPDVIQQAYDEALRFHKAVFQDSKGETWLSKASSMQDVLDVLAESQRKHQAKIASRWKPAATAVSWWKRASSTMIQYETVIDSLVSSNPEYAGLVWGAMKFLFKATLNHQEISSKIAQAFAEIGAVLPEAEFITRLFPSREIRFHLASAYARIVEFCIRATEWYEKMRKSSLKKVFNAAFKTWPLVFQDVRHEIERHIIRVRELAATGHHAETRHLHLRVQELMTYITSTQAFGELLVETHVCSSRLTHCLGPETTPLRPNPSIVTSLPFIHDRVMQYLACNTFNPQQVLSLATTMRDRRRARGGSTPPGVWASKQLQDWISNPESALLQVQGSVLRAEQTRDLASDLIQLLQATSQPVIWYLSSASSSGQARVSVTDILRSLIEQTISQHQHAQGSQPWRLNDSHFQHCKTDSDWLRLFVAVINHMSKLIIVIDAHQEAAGEVLSVIKEFWDDMTAQKVATIVKVLVLTYGTESKAILGDFPVLPATSAARGSPRRSSGSSRRAGLSRTGSRFQSPRTGTPGGPEALKPFVLQLVSHGNG